VNVEDSAVCGRRALSAHASRMKSSGRKEVRIHDRAGEKNVSVNLHDLSAILKATYKHSLVSEIHERSA
jgi:hypothetical protein